VARLLTVMIVFMVIMIMLAALQARHLMKQPILLRQTTAHRAAPEQKEKC